MSLPPDFDIAAVTARQIAGAVRSGALTALSVTERFLEQARNSQPRVEAFRHLDPESARRAARQVDAGSKGELAGVPLGIKDVFDTADMPTAHGSAVHAGHRPGRDAAAVHLARRAGAVVLGKTVTTEFAALSPGPTRNPHGPDHTPGGSSSGSAAALAVSACLLAFGTQTSGSTIRPAAFCGVVGLKVGPGVIDRTGVKALSESLDVVGIMARDAGDAALFAAVCARRPDWLTPAPAPARAALFLPDQSQGLPVEAACAERLARVARILGADTARQPAWWDGLGPAQDQVFAWEASAALAWERDCRADRVTPITRAFMQRQREMASPDAHARGLAMRDACLADLDALFGAADVLLTPAAPGEAPPGLGSTGSADYNVRWTLLGLPSLTLPVGLGPRGLPLGVQVVARRGREAQLLAHAAAMEGRLAAEGLGRPHPPGLVAT
ncbi:amidase [Paracoccus sp. YIM 132242]|uniref:Amidase n=1 Tax=Paracoccus lichenicola TaxID=2665644 RepID=A0A6L6HTX5_9RHOB|nr:amidase [Paracoccus lichenicola]MTE01565.1 amidase [Paracoccus lichenicola]